MRFQNLFKATGEKAPEPFRNARTLFLVIDRKSRTVRIQCRRPSAGSTFSWPLPTTLGANSLTALAEYAASAAGNLLSGDAKPEARYQIEIGLLRRIAIAESLDGGLKNGRGHIHAL